MKSRKNSRSSSKSVRGKKNSRSGSKSKSRSNNFKKNKVSKHKRRVSLRGGMTSGDGGLVPYSALEALYDVQRILKFEFNPNDLKERTPAYNVITKYYEEREQKKKPVVYAGGTNENIVELLNEIAQKLKTNKPPFSQKADAPEEVNLKNLHTPMENNE